MSDKTVISDRYLGDGVYASFDGYNIVLDLRGQDAGIRIGLEPEVLCQFDEFRANLNANLRSLAHERERIIRDGV